MQLLWKLLKSPFWLLALFTGAKSFADNPFIGSAWLNRHGLHRLRCRIADRMADWRRRRLAAALTDVERAQFARDGFILVPDFLPADEFAALVQAATGPALPALEMHQGPATTRRVILDADPDAPSPLARVAGNDRLRALMRYVAATGGTPLVSLQAIVTRATSGERDPQTAAHIDTFHATAKAWLFLHDVGPEDGPFFYVPGSHRRTPARLDWEYRESLAAATHPVRYHARGSFRLPVERLPDLGLPAPQPVVVRANTLVVADTSGLHGRTPSVVPGVRMEVYASLRRNPFLPWNGGHVMSLPWLRARVGTLAYGGVQALARRGIRLPWQAVGARRLGEH